MNRVRQDMNLLMTRVDWKVLVLVVVAFVGHAWSLRAFFIADDFMLIESAHQRLAAANLLFLLNDALEPWGNGFWRPLFNLWFTGMYWLFGWTPLAYHMVSIAIHCTNALLAFWLFQRLTGGNDTRIGVCVLAVWAVFPVYWEAVAWISSMSELLVVAFVLGMLIALTYLPRNIHTRTHELTPAERWAGPVVIFIFSIINMLTGFGNDGVMLVVMYILLTLVVIYGIKNQWLKLGYFILAFLFLPALLTRENGIVVGPLLVTYLWFNDDRMDVRLLIKKAIVLVIFLAGSIAIGSRFWLTPEYVPEYSYDPFHIVGRMGDLLGTILFPWMTVAWPMDESVQIAMWNVGQMEAWPLLGMFTLAAILVLLIGGRMRHRLLCVWLLCALLPIALFESYAPSRYFYMPSVAAFLLLALLIHDAWRLSPPIGKTIVLWGSAAVAITLVPVMVITNTITPTHTSYWREANRLSSLYESISEYEEMRFDGHSVYWVQDEMQFPMVEPRVLRSIQPRLTGDVWTMMTSTEMDEWLKRSHSRETLRSTVVITSDGVSLADTMVHPPTVEDVQSRALSLDVVIERNPPVVALDDAAAQSPIAGFVDTDPTDAPAICVAWCSSREDVVGFLLYCIVDTRGPVLLAEVDAAFNAFEWRAGEDAVAPLMTGGPRFGAEHVFIIVEEYTDGTRRNLGATMPLLLQPNR